MNLTSSSKVWTHKRNSLSLGLLRVPMKKKAKQKRKQLQSNRVMRFATDLHEMRLTNTSTMRAVNRRVLTHEREVKRCNRVVTYQ